MKLTMRRSRSAFATITLVIVLALVGAVGFAGLQFKEAFAPSRPIKAVATLDVSAQTTAIAAQKSQTDLQAALAADQAALAAEKAKAQAASGFNAGVGIALSGEPNPSINVRVASTLQGEVAKTLDPASAAQIANDQTIITQLKASNNTTSAALAATQQERDQALETAKVAAAKAKVSDDKAQLSAAQNVTLSTQTQTLADKLKVWSEAGPGLYSRIEHLTIGIGVLIGLIVCIGWLLPLIGKAFPAFAPAAKLISAPFLLVLHLLHEGEKKALIAAHDATKLVLAKTETALDAEKAAHVVTQAMLVKVATTPDALSPAPVTVVNVPSATSIT